MHKVTTLQQNLLNTVPHIDNGTRIYTYHHNGRWLTTTTTPIVVGKDKGGRNIVNIEVQAVYDDAATMLKAHRENGYHSQNWRCINTEAMTLDMRRRGVNWELYRDGRKPFPVFKQAEFLKALGMDVPNPLPIGETYIEVSEAYWIWRAALTSPEQAQREKEADFEARSKAFSDTMNKILSDPGPEREPRFELGKSVTYIDKTTQEKATGKIQHIQINRDFVSYGIEKEGEVVNIYEKELIPLNS